jgi:MATE family multidrug resistance protein
MYHSFEFMGHAPELVALEQPYFLTFVWAAYLFLMKAVLASYFSGIGRTRVVMIADVLGVAANVPISYVLIFGKLGLPALGIVGAALGTVIANALSIGIYLLFYFNPIHAARFKVEDSFVLSPGILRRYVRLGLPSALEVLVALGTFNVFLLLFQSYGIAAGAAMAIVFNWDMLSFVPLMGLNIAIMSLSGRSVGAGDMSRVNAVIKAGLLIAVSYAGFMAVLFITQREALLGVFATPGEDFSEVLAIGSKMMVGLATYAVADALILVSTGVLRGAGDTRWLMLTSITVHLITLAVQLLVILYWKMPAIVCWWVFVAMLISNAVIYLLRVRGARWRQPERLARVMAED